MTLDPPEPTLNDSGTSATDAVPTQPQAAAPLRLAPAGQAGNAPLSSFMRAVFVDWWQVWVVAVASRIGVFAVGALAQYAAEGRGIEQVLPFAKAGTYIHYANVVNVGYNAGNATEYPLLPGAMYLLGQMGLPLSVAALLVVNIAFVIGIVGFAMLGERYVGKESALRAAMYLALFPTAHFFSLASTESIMLGGLVVATLLALRGTAWSWLAAGGAAAVCALSRPPGALVGIVLLAIAVGQLADGRLRGRRVAAALAAGAAIPASVLGFYLYLEGRTGDLLASVHAQKQFGRSMSLDGPLQAVAGALDAVRGGSYGEGIELVAALLIAAGIVVFALRAAGSRWEVRGWVAFALASLLMPMATGLVWQMPRFALVIPPLFWALGMLGRRQWLHMAALVLFPMALAVKVVFEVVGVSQ